MNLNPNTHLTPRTFSRALKGRWEGGGGFGGCWGRLGMGAFRVFGGRFEMLGLFWGLWVLWLVNWWRLAVLEADR